MALAGAGELARIGEAKVSLFRVWDPAGTADRHEDAYFPSTSRFQRVDFSICSLGRRVVSRETPNIINAILFVAQNGCKWRALPKCVGNWHAIYTRMNRRTNAGV